MTGRASAEAAGGPGPGGRRRVQRLGETALMVDCPGLDDVIALHAALADDPLPGQAELVPAATTLLVSFSAPLREDGAARCASDLASRPGARSHASGSREVTIRAVYDGEDLAAVADLLGCSPEAVVSRHTTARWTAAFSGFAPGFAYLVQQGSEERLAVPRRDSPRTRVPRGSVALAGDFSAVYPSDSPGGWQLIGRTGTPVWDLDADPPALITPGTAVRFEAVREGVAAGGPEGGGAEDAPTDGTAVRAEDAPPPALRIDSAGLSTLIQDAGRPGRADWGVSPSGWSDPAAARAANRLVGNPPGAPLLESTGGSMRLTALRDVVLAATGASADLTIAEEGSGSTPRAVPAHRPFALRAGQRLSIGPARRGLRICLAVRGGLVVREVLGSAATDTLSGLGPQPLSRGTRLAVGPEPRRAVALHEAPLPLPSAEEVTEILVSPGPRADWFAPGSLGRLPATVWRVTEESNRVAVRLAPEDDAALARRPERDGEELPSEGLAPGSVQVPTGGQPIVFLADRPVTGGYPVLALVGPEGRRLLAQAPPGTRVRLVPGSAASAPDADPGDAAPPVTGTVEAAPSITDTAPGKDAHA